MSVSFIVPVWREEVYASVCLPWIQQQVEWFGAELIEIRGQRSIFESLEKGRRLAKNRFLFYVHDDVRLLRPADLVPQIVKTFNSLDDTGLIGPVGKVNREYVPWWKNVGPIVGHYCVRGRHDQINYHYAKADGHMSSRAYDDSEISGWSRFANAGLVDGFFLCEDRERLDVPWDVDAFGANWHAYDMDRCLQTHALGLAVRVPPWLFLHDCAGHAGYKGTDPKPKKNKLRNAGDKLWLSDLGVANDALRQKWNLPVVK